MPEVSEDEVAIIVAAKRFAMEDKQHRAWGNNYPRVLGAQVLLGRAVEKVVSK